MFFRHVPATGYPIPNRDGPQTLATTGTDAENVRKPLRPSLHRRFSTCRIQPAAHGPSPVPLACETPRPIRLPTAPTARHVSTKRL